MDTERIYVCKSCGQANRVNILRFAPEVKCGRCGFRLVKMLGDQFLYRVKAARGPKRPSLKSLL